MNLEEKTLSSEVIYNGSVVKLNLVKAELPNGKTASREVVNHPSGVTVAALTNDNELLFVRQYRYPFHEIVLELPAGKLEKTGTPLENAKRELLEETGAVGYNFISLGKQMVSPGYCDEVVHMYMCRIDHFEQQQPDEDEFLEILRIPLDKAVEMVLNNIIVDGKTQTAVLKASMLLRSGAV
ncbi:MAG: NUDIX hydrolase [Clostridia bacterium]|nr:NUDIX hydrolase [Clostridia bacterium]